MTTTAQVKALRRDHARKVAAERVAREALERAIKEAHAPGAERAAIP